MNKQTIFKYLIECILIFVSVIAAFIVDSKREDKQLEEQELTLLREVTTDLVNDTTQFTMMIGKATEMKNKLNKLIRQLETKAKNDSIDDYALKYPFSLTIDKTIYDEIKFAGGFRFIEDRDLINQLLAYYNIRGTFIDDFQGTFVRLDQNIFNIIETETKFVEGQDVFGINGVQYRIEQESLNRLRGHQRIVNLLYEKRGLLNILESRGGLSVLLVRNYELREKCESYLQTRK